jgi:hypothetical protein
MTCIICGQVFDAALANTEVCSRRCRIRRDHRSMQEAEHRARLVRLLHQARAACLNAKLAADEGALHVVVELACQRVRLEDTEDLDWLRIDLATGETAA